MIECCLELQCSYHKVRLSTLCIVDVGDCAQILEHILKVCNKISLICNIKLFQWELLSMEVREAKYSSIYQ